MFSRLLHGRPIKLGAIVAAVLVVSVLYVMEAKRDQESGISAVQQGAMMVPNPSSKDLGREDRVEDDMDFSDPATGGLIPLMNVEGRMTERLSPNLRVGDLAARDGAPYARISVELIEALEDVITSTDASIYIISGYRHPARNAMPEIGGSVESQHMAGRAADLSSPGLTPLELSGLVLDVLGCDIGLGLGGSSIHMDVRGRRAVWAKEGAEMTTAEFSRWVAVRCGDEIDIEDEADESETLDMDAVIAVHEVAMRRTARQLLDAGMSGGVALDLRGQEPVVYMVPAGSPDAVGLGLAELIDTAHPGRYYAFACIVKDGDVIRGFMRL